MQALASQSLIYHAHIHTHGCFGRASLFVCLQAMEAMGGFAGEMGVSTESAMDDDLDDDAVRGTHGAPFTIRL